MIRNMAEVTCPIAHKSILGESPVWNAAERALYWVDILGPSIQRYDPASGEARVWDMAEEIGSMAFRAGGGVVAALRSGFHFVDLESGAAERVADPEPDKPDNRFNDGKCDRAGRYWCGTMAMDMSAGVGALYRLDADLSCHKMVDGITVPNGLAWSPDDRVMYFADTRAQTVWAYDFDIATGAIANRRVFISTEGVAARIDGATVDRDGNYWCAHIDDWSIACYDPNGALARTVRLPVQHPTMCAFGDNNLDVLYVTSLTTRLKPGEEKDQPLAGALFAIHGLGAVGLPEPCFAG